MATETLLMAAVAAGADRQAVHETVRRHSHAVTDRVKAGEGSVSELIDHLKAEPAFARVDFAKALDPAEFVGRAPQQVTEFLAAEVEPRLARYAGRAAGKSDLSV
jgi:adenylosuccinate lyase